MNRPLRIHRHHCSLHALGGNAPLALQASRGTVVSCLSGELWVTQDGDPRDYRVPRGYRYCCSTDGVIVANALNGSGDALVYWRNPEGCAHFSRNSVHFDAESYQRLMQQARRLRDASRNRLASKLAHGLSARLQLLLQRCIKVTSNWFRSQKGRLPQ